MKKLTVLLSLSALALTGCSTPRPPLQHFSSAVVDCYTTPTALGCNGNVTNVSPIYEVVQNADGTTRIIHVQQPAAHPLGDVTKLLQEQQGTLQEMLRYGVQ